MVCALTRVGMCDRLIEDIVSVTETLMVSDIVDLEAYAHPDAKLTVNEKLDRANAGLDDHAGRATHEKITDLRKALRRHQEMGLFRRGSC